MPSCSPAPRSKSSARTSPKLTWVAHFCPLSLRLSLTLLLHRLADEQRRGHLPLQHHPVHRRLKVRSSSLPSMRPCRELTCLQPVSQGRPPAHEARRCDHQHHLRHGLRSSRSPVPAHGKSLTSRSRRARLTFFWRAEGQRWHARLRTSIIRCFTSLDQSSSLTRLRSAFFPSSRSRPPRAPSRPSPSLSRPKSSRKPSASSASRVSSSSLSSLARLTRFARSLAVPAQSTPPSNPPRAPKSRWKTGASGHRRLFTGVLRSRRSWERCVLLCATAPSLTVTERMLIM